MYRWRCHKCCRFGCPFVSAICLRSSGMRLPFRGLRISAPGVLTNESSHTPQLCSYDSETGHSGSLLLRSRLSSARPPVRPTARSPPSSSAAAASRRTGCSSYRHKFDKSLGIGQRSRDSPGLRVRAYLTGEGGEGRVV